MENMLTTAALDNASIATTEEAWKFEDETQRRLVGGMLVFIGFAGLVGNAVVIIAFVLSEKLQNITNIFVINLAVSDFLSSLLVPFFVQNVLTKTEELLPTPVCAMVGILLYVFVSSSIVNHAVIAYNRYCSISRPDSVYRKMFSPARIAIMLVLIWTYSSIIPLVTHLSGITEFGFNSKYRICSLDVVETNALLVSIVRALAVDVVCLIVVVIFYVNFFLFVKRHSNQLMHIYSYERRKGSENLSNASSTMNRGSDVSQVTGMTRQTSTLTRIVDLDDPNGVETVLSKSGHRKAWRPVGRSVSQTIITPTDAFNGHVTEDVIREEDETNSTEDADDHVTKIEIEEEGKSDPSKKISECSEALSAIDESAEYVSEGKAGNDDKVEGNGKRTGKEIELDSSKKISECAEALSADDESAEYVREEKVEKNDKGSGDGERTDSLVVEKCENEEYSCGNDVSNGVEQCNSISGSQEEVRQTATAVITENNSCNNINGDVSHASSTEDSTTEHESNDDDEAFHRRESATVDDVTSAKYRQERNSSTGSPTHSTIANQRRRFSELAKRSFFGRNISVTSQSERVRCMQVRLNRRQVQITKNLIVVVCAFVVCVSQYVVFLAIPSLERLLPYSAVLITVSHAINPVIYAIKHPTFKVVIRPMLMCKLSKIPGPSRFLKAILRK